MNTSDNNNVVLEEIFEIPTNSTKEIRSLYKKNEEIIEKLRALTGL